MIKNITKELKGKFRGEFHTDTLYRSLYATDASVYRKYPLAVAYPRDKEDLKLLVRIAGENSIGLVLRTAGTSLAGQCVGDGIVVDVSRHFTAICSLDVENRTVTVQPGVVRDELNQYLHQYGLFFGPNTSTSNRCMIGGMVGNNSCGTTSIQYGVTRDKVLALQTILADGSEAEIRGLTRGELAVKLEGEGIESNIYNTIDKILSNNNIRSEILQEFPKPEIHRRNTGYALDELLKYQGYGGDEDRLNLCSLLSGSEGTLAITTEITLALDPLPPPNSVMVVTHYNTLEACLKDVAPLMKHSLFLCEMMDKVILDCTANNRLYDKSREFVQGDPAALLMLELRDHTANGLSSQLEGLLQAIEKTGNSYAQVVLEGDEIARAIDLRKAGLGLLGNMVGDRKAVACIEDTAVALEDLAHFIMDFTGIMEQYGQKAVYYAHAGAGELHLRPILNLKEEADVDLFRTITTEVAKLTKRYRGSFSGEHGDGRVRGEFIPLMIGEQNYQHLRAIKSAFDPQNIFNPGKIVDPLPMDGDLRYKPGRAEPEVKTIMDFSDSQGILRAAEQCNGSGDCRKSHHMPGGMCPSYHATKDERDTTRARANVLREVLTIENGTKGFQREELKEAMDLCISCKACARECPSNVDVATYKSEALFQQQEAAGYSLRSKLFAHAGKLNRIGSRAAWLVNGLHRGGITSGLMKWGYGIARERTLPKVYSFKFNKYLQKVKSQNVITKSKVLLYIDEFTETLDIEVGKDAIELLVNLGYDVALFKGESTRAYISKGFLKQAVNIAENNLRELAAIIDDYDAFIGLEPSAILTFRDEYKRFNLDQNTLEHINNKALLFEEFIAREIKKGVVNASLFTDREEIVQVHVHCHQKALADQKVTFDCLNLPENYTVRLINSGCCGMAGSFGYEKEHYKLSMKIGELRLFPAIRKKGSEVIIAANGTSCRHQIYDGTKRLAQHPVSILNRARK